jgi:hypothetical protein
MKKFGLAAVIVLGWLIAAWSAPVKPLPPQQAGPEMAPAPTDSTANAAPPQVKHTPKNTEISTELGASDSLGILPTDVETPYAGGTRRVHLESTIFRREEPVVYNSNGRRDAFRALIVDEKKEGEVQTDLLRLENAVLSGVVWSLGQYMAMVKDKDGKTFFLREGDPVYQGRVLTVTQSQTSFEVTDFGEYERITLKVKG